MLSLAGGVMNYQGYSISAVKEQTLGPRGDSKEKPVIVTSYSVSVGEKIIAVGLPNIDAAKKVVDTRRKVRTRAGLDPGG